MTYSHDEPAELHSSTGGAISLLIFPHASIQKYYAGKLQKQENMGRDVIFSLPF